MLDYIKIRVNCPAHSEKIQKLLIKAGFNWAIGRGCHYTDQPYLYTTRRVIEYSDEYSLDFFLQDRSREVTLKDIIKLSK